LNTRETVGIVEVAPRDGFQAVKPFIATEKKIAVTEALMQANFKRLEVGAFVSPKAIPQMADSREIHEHFAQSGASASHRLGATGRENGRFSTNLRSSARTCRCTCFRVDWFEQDACVV